MKKTLTLLLVLLMGFSLFACNGKSEEPESQQPAESAPVIEETPLPVVDQAQQEALEATGQLHAFLDYGYSLDTIVADTLQVDETGTYYTITGTVVFVDDASTKYSCAYEITLIKKSDGTYKTGSWENGTPMAELDPSKDYFEELKNYIIDEGAYDSGSKTSYIEEQIVSNEWYYLITDGTEIKFWRIGSYETPSSKFVFSYECFFTKGNAPRFSLGYEDAEEYYNGVMLEGEMLFAEGKIDAVTGEIYDTTVSTAYGCTLSDLTDEIKTSQMECKDFVTKIMKEAHIAITYEQLFGSTAEQLESPSDQPVDYSAILTAEPWVTKLEDGTVCKWRFNEDGTGTFDGGLALSIVWRMEENVVTWHLTSATDGNEGGFVIMEENGEYCMRDGFDGKGNLLLVQESAYDAQ